MAKLKFVVGKGGEGGAFGFGGKGIIAVVLIVIIAVAYARGANPALAAGKNMDRTLEEYGVNLAAFPEILTLEPGMPQSGNYERALTASWTLNRDAENEMSKAGADYKVEFLYRASPDEPQEDICTVYLKLSDAKPKPGFDVDCYILPKIKKEALLGSGSCGEITCKNAPAGGYKVRVSLKPEGEQSFMGEKETKKDYGFYTEEYVELLDKQIGVCKEPEFDNCNVIECKKRRIDYDLAFYGVLDIKLELNKLAGEVFSGTCATYHNNFRKVDFDGCSKEEVNDLNNKFARVRMLAAAFASTKGGVKSEKDYADYASNVDGFKKSAVAGTLACSRGIGAFKGAYSYLDSLGWDRVPQTGGFDGWEGKINAELDNVLKNLRPGIGNLRADAYDDAHISLSWEVPIGAETVKADSYKISQFNTRWAGKLTKENQRVLQQEVLLPGDSTSFNSNGLIAGKYEFEVRILEGGGGTGKQLSMATAATGLFDDAYLETYKGGVEGGCVTEGAGKDPLSLLECDVYEQKKDALGDPDTSGGDRKDKARVIAAYNKAVKDKLVDGNRCSYKPKGGMFSAAAWKDCTPEEIDTIYHNYLIESGAESDYYCTAPVGIVVYDALKVCMVKRQTVNTLINRGWKDLRVKKGWENDV